MRHSTILLRHYIFDIKMARATVLSRFVPFSLRAYPGFEKTLHDHILFAAADFFALLEH